jgi:hypothetical protein
VGCVNKFFAVQCFASRKNAALSKQSPLLTVGTSKVRMGNPTLFAGNEKFRGRILVGSH